MATVELDAAVPDAEWDAFVAAHPDGWWWHTSGWRAYQRACGWADASIGFRSDGALVGLAPLLVKDGAAVVDGKPEPLVVDDAWRRPAWDAAVQHLSRVGVKRWTTASRAAGNADVFVHASTRVVDVTQPEKTLWAGTRRSYHALIHRAADRYRIAYVDRTMAGRIVEGACRHLHAAAAGRATRPASTWQLMAQWAASGHAHVWFATDHDVDVGFVYVYAWKGWAYYGHAAAIERDATHALVWEAVRSLGSLGVTHFEMGALPDHATDKERSVYFFKTGFGGTDWPVRTCDVRL